MPESDPKREVILSQTEWQEFGRIYFGRNGRDHGHEFFLGVSGNDVQSVLIPQKDRKRVAALLRRFAKRLDP